MPLEKEGLLDLKVCINIYLFKAIKYLIFSFLISRSCHLKSFWSTEEKDIVLSIARKVLILDLE